MRITIIVTFIVGLVLSQGAPEVPTKPCEPAPLAYGGLSGTASEFAVSQPYPNLALRAEIQYEYEEVFRNSNAASTEPSFVGQAYLKTYETSECAAICDQTPDCRAFNLYFERAPMLNPAPACPDPEGMVSIKCSLFSSALDPHMATNAGQYREEFSVLIAGSNGFNRI